MDKFTSDGVTYWLEERPDGLFNLMSEHDNASRPTWLACWTHEDLASLKYLITRAMEGLS